jgi:hypothetical protein
MSRLQLLSTIDRLFTEMDADRVDELGFLDPRRTPRLFRFDRVLNEPLAWVLGPPWLGKSTVAIACEWRLRLHPEALGGIENRYALTCLGDPEAVGGVPPVWWRTWCQDLTPRPAVWLIDGVDEGLDRNKHLLSRILGVIDETPAGHLRHLRLVLFSRPHAELGNFRSELERSYAGISRRTESPCFWLARIDREAAEDLAGQDRFPRVLELIERCQLQSVAGYPVVLTFLKTYPETTGLSVPLVWRGILTALLGERHTNTRARFNTAPEERFGAACRIAAVLTLTRRDAIRSYSPDPGVPIVGTLFQSPENRLLAAAQESCQTAAFRHLPEQGAYRFAQRNVQDWLTAFALGPLPLPALRSALTGPDGAILPGLREPARLIRAATDRPEVRAEIDRLGGGVLLPSDAAGTTLTEAVRCLDQLEELARSAPWGLRVRADRQDDLARLRVEGIGAELARRLYDPNRSHQVKQLLIEVAEATRAFEAVEPALALVLDWRQHEHLRYGAMEFLARFGGDEHLRQLEEPVGECIRDTEIDRRLRGVLISELLDRGLWPVWRAALSVPPADPDLYDSRVIVLRRLNEAMTVEDARQLLPHLRGLCRRHADAHQPHRFPDLVSQAIDLLAGQSPPLAADVDDLVGFAQGLLDEDLGWSMCRDVAIRLRNHPTARRRFYGHDVEILRGGRGGHRVGAWSLLLPDDWRWLRDQALGPWAGCREVWLRAYQMARQSREEGDLPAEDWQEFVYLVEQHMPGLPAELEEGVRCREQAYQQEVAERQEREQREAVRIPLADCVRQILENPRLDPAGRMRHLGAVCFAESVELAPPVVGGWTDLPEELRCRVLDACRRGLEGCDPTPIPPQGSFPLSILLEGASFSQVVLSPGQAAWLTERMIRQWLPTALFAPASGDWAALIRACWDVSPAATEQVLIATIADEARRREDPFSLRSIPSECWTDAMTERVVALLRDELVRPRARRELLEHLSARCRERACGIAAEWATRPVAKDDSDHLRQAGRNVLLVCDPPTALGLAEADFDARGTASLEELFGLWGWRDEFHVRWDRWPADVLERLGRLLLRGFPPANDPEFLGGFLKPDQELRQLRGQLISHLLSRPEPAAQEALSRLAELDPTVREWVATHRASEQAGRLLPTVNPAAARDPAALSVTEAVRLLDRAGYRLIRSADDLLDAVLESLHQVQAGVGHDLPMLYNAPDRKAGGARPRKHLEEDALQAYLRRRLLELLSRLADGVDVQVGREEQVARRQRLDLRVTAPCHGSGRLATVVIEVKWSTNRETGTGLVSQLGQRYLLGEGLTHGVFLVGWSGEWRPGDGSGASTAVGGLERFLTNQRDDFCHAGQQGGGLRIEPFILDVHW